MFDPNIFGQMVQTFARNWLAMFGHDVMCHSSTILTSLARPAPKVAQKPPKVKK